MQCLTIHAPILTLNNGTSKVVKDFNYLDNILSLGGSVADEVAARIWKHKRY